MTNVNDVIDRIEANFESEHLPLIQKFVQQPSVSATGEGISETCTYLMSEMLALGAKDVHLVPPPEGEFGYPVVYGEIIEDPKLATMLLYSMYDVQPVIPAEWIIDGRQVNPFGAEVHQFEWISGFSGKCLIGRGAINTKAPTEAFFNVLRTIRKEHGKLPVNVIFMIEGEEELGSLHIEYFIDQCRERLKRADFLYFPFFSERFDGAVTMFLGVKGIISVKVRIQGGEWGGPAERDIHSMSSGVVENPIFQMARLISSLKDDDSGDILVPGIMEDPDLVGPNAEDSELLKKLAASTDVAQLKKSLGVRTFRRKNGRELVGVDFLVAESFKPGLSVNGISGGYVGQGKTIIPKEVSADIDIRLAPFQRVDKVKSIYRDYLQKKFPMAEISFDQGYPPAKVSVKNPYVQALIQAMEHYGKKVVPTPIVAGSAPLSYFQAKFDIPFVMGGLGHGGRQHSANEYAVLESPGGKIGGILDYERSVARFLCSVEK